MTGKNDPYDDVCEDVLIPTGIELVPSTDLESNLVNVLLRSYHQNTSLAAPGALANRLQRRTARKANEANLDPPNQKSEITSL